MSTTSLVPKADTSRDPSAPEADRGAVVRPALTAMDQPLPESLPLPPPAEVVEAVRIPGPLAVLLAPLLWFMPKTMGPHLAACSWRAAVAACVLWSACGIGCVVVSYDAPGSGIMPYVLGQTPLHDDWPGGPCGFWPRPTLSELLRSPLAALATAISREIRHGEDLAIGLCGVAGAMAGLIVLAVAIMPYAAAGEPWHRLLGRCIKLTLWSTTMLVPLGLMLQVSFLVTRSLLARRVNDFGAVALFGAWFLWVWLRSGLRYAGPRQGPGWEPAQPICEGCGYALVGLTARQRCPECGRPVRESLPAARYPTPLDEARGCVGQMAAFVDTLIDALVSPTFFRHLAARQGYRGARRFAIYLCISITLAAVPTMLLVGWLLGASFPPEGELIVLVGSFGVAATAVALLTLGPTVLLEAARHRRPIQQTAVFTFHAVAWGLPIFPIGLLAAGVIAAKLGVPPPGTSPLPPISSWAVTTSPETLVEALSYCLYPLIPAVYGCIRCVQGRRQMAHATT